MQDKLNENLEDLKNGLPEPSDVLAALQGIIYPISDSPWVSPTQVVPKKSGITVVQNEKEEEVATCLTFSWRKSMLKTKRRPLSQCPFGTYAYRRMPFGLCNAPATFQRNALKRTWCSTGRNAILWYNNELSLATSSPRTTLKLIKQRAPNWQLPFEVMCDASDFAIGAVLGQREDGKPYVIYYASKTLNEAQRNYTTTEKELLAVVFALDKFRAYLVGSFIIVFTDHSALTDKKGMENVVADHLSRKWKAQDRKHFFAKIHAYYWEEPFLFKYCADQIIRKCVPKEEQQGILSHCHESACGGHFASQKTAMKGVAIRV
ncbi:Retrovirus-related Pol polyprotein from transposon opus [Vitis vinifera]|uniref:Retrovirus-related Pol polyprotein from transposon opus n=1 Tax=Vitis vinifera TaxID=29760 RepID=A0A438CQ86_VITVI|nr:Retrovirus-related Pol polyprotein from transposon opus [Vitis vinifera]